jgi:hypothetical protein
MSEHHSISENAAGATASDLDIHRSLGRIEGQLQALISSHSATDSKVSKIDERLRFVESRSAVHGASAGFLSAVGVTMIAQYLKHKFGAV